MISTSRYDAGAIVVTGASRGVGRCVAKDLVSEGSTVVAIARDAGNLEDLRSEVTGMPGRLLIHRGDVCDSEWFESVLAEVETAEPIRGLVANAGVNPIMKTAVNTSAEMFDHIMGVNVRATFMCSTAVIRRMRSGGLGDAARVGERSCLSAPWEATCRSLGTPSTACRRRRPCRWPGYLLLRPQLTGSGSTWSVPGSWRPTSPPRSAPVPPRSKALNGRRLLDD